MSKNSASIPTDRNHRQSCLRFESNTNFVQLSSAGMSPCCNSLHTPLVGPLLKSPTAITCGDTLLCDVTISNTRLKAYWN